MFGDLMGNMEEKQNAMKEKLQSIELEEKIEGISISGNGAREILDIEIDQEYFKPEKKEELEDLLLTAFNNLLDKIAVEEAKASQSMISDMLPPGMEGLFGN
ncbi:MAG: YbaB/EbfC family nucleoid-associated protein [Saprospiraceae bacterium]|nr:YbaB/EbfC family nucleoid-associated protein [Saprospiraceae bacterium]